MSLTRWRERKLPQAEECPWGYDVTRLVGKTLSEVRGVELGERMTFIDTDGVIYILGNHLESNYIPDDELAGDVYIADIAGDLADLVDSPIILAEEVSSGPQERGRPYLWTFYRFATAKGSVTVRFCDYDSDHYYGKWVDFDILPRPDITADTTGSTPPTA